MLRCAVSTIAFVIASVLTPSLAEEQSRREQISAAFGSPRIEVYKTIGDVQLDVFIVEPEGHQAGDRRPAIVFFFGGGWRSGTPAQFAEHCKYLASRGMVAMAADYRVRSRHGTKAESCVSDAKSAVRWIRANADRLGIDANRIVAAGGSAGGHIAACTGVIEGFDEAGEDTSISSVPNAMVLFNPVLVLAPVPSLQLNKRRAASLPDRMGVEPVKLSPYHHIKADIVPCIIFHGTADRTVPFATIDRFTQTMTDAGNNCTLHRYERQGHGFFNFSRGTGEMYRATVKAMDEFLADLGYLEGSPTIDE